MCLFVPRVMLHNSMVFSADTAKVIFIWACPCMWCNHCQVWSSGNNNFKGLFVICWSALTSHCMNSLFIYSHKKAWPKGLARYLMILFLVFKKQKTKNLQSIMFSFAALKRYTSTFIINKKYNLPFLQNENCQYEIKCFYWVTSS